ncbi:hypothetical protein HYV84_05265 [Candidatus Woesearchaeota archaeon]|nr:hypothetical protein [Candidatus Woesearchaeota archaeon]
MKKRGFWKYPKLTLLALTFLLAYILFKSHKEWAFLSVISTWGLPGAFLLGMFYAYGFTSAPATALLLLTAKQYPTLAAGFLGGLGALVGDLVIFSVVRASFADEFRMLSQERLVKAGTVLVPKKIRKFLLPILAGVIISSPLPDEIGVILLAGSTSLSTKWFSLISFILNTTGILIILRIGTAI